MAVAMDSGWTSPRFGIGGGAGGKKRGWGEDQNKLLQFMIGQPIESSNDQTSTTTLDLLGGSSSSSTKTPVTETLDLKLDMEMSAPSGWEKRLDLKLGKFYYVNLSTGKSTYNHPFAIATSCWDLQSELDRMMSSSPSPSPSSSFDLVDLKLNLAVGSTSANSGSSFRESMPSLGISTIEAVQEALKRSIKSPTSSATSSSEIQLDDRSRRGGGVVAEESTSVPSPRVVLTGCKRCLMYVMLTRSDPRCPKCGSSVINPLQDLPSKKPRLELDLL
ncbi:uncharacterized protein LOC9641363 [Selaginella moellendorffii]|nr:uncharacterized protein LOC9641363 [Selaginella moellendorffii]|eukprot:XP_002973096.2 uncharacterized protein LOC9641363 [Selaginella moellendorffii]